MASTIETGHAKNVANFHQVISFCAGYGKNYNPSRKELTLTNLQNVYSQAQAVLNDVKNTKAAFDNATNARREAFASLPKFSTQVVNALAVSGVSPLAVNDAKGILRKMKGRRAGETKVAAAPATTPTKGAEDKKISVSQLSYDSLIDHFAKLVATVSQQPAYIPNEKELSTGTLQTKLNDLSTVNSAVIDSYTTYSNSRANRNSALYDPLVGMVKLAANVKLYVKSIFGATSPQYKQVSGITFNTIK